WPAPLARARISRREVSLRADIAMRRLDNRLANLRRPLVVHAARGLDEGLVLRAGELGHRHAAFANRLQPRGLLFARHGDFPGAGFDGGLAQHLLLLFAERAPHLAVGGKY